MEKRLKKGRKDGKEEFKQQPGGKEEKEKLHIVTTPHAVIIYKL